MKQKDSYLVWVLVVAAVVALVTILYFGNHKPSTQQQAQTMPVQNLPTKNIPPTYAATGTLVTGFPKGLILDASAALNSSYSINYSASMNQSTAVYTSKLTMAQLFANYQTYLKNNSWTITNTITKYASSRGLYANNATNVVSIAIVDQGSTRQVTVSYVSK